MKPDWATRLQRTFARKYDAGFAKGLMFGKAVGARDEQERIVERFEACLCFEKYDCKDDRCLGIMAFIALIKGEQSA